MASTEEHQHPENGQADTEPSTCPSELEKARISNACETQDVEELRAIAIAPGGFLSDEHRTQAWPILLGLDANEVSNGSTDHSGSWKALPRHRDEDQVKLDVDRSFVYYPNGISQA
ncbi:hypothetical protein NPX13_g6656 [Xylaria arbuscula]|uniref:Rab-GAP TBC domain-containing protein n=1 Tax=Xylaria arbuscula TaxID=114810 RepID=A0A9W8NBG0_9PEZI|nr:hypothetical protein NPX13_g6656 [Xylaria arbuscula]